MTLTALVESDEWNKYFLNKKGEKVPFTEEIEKEWISMKNQHSLVYITNPKPKTQDK